MSSLIRVDGWYRVEGDFGRVPSFDDYVAMGIDEIPAGGAPKQCSWDDTIWVAESVPSVELLVEVTLAPGTGESSVEGIESFCLGRKDVLVPLNGAEHVFGIHLFEDAHETTVDMLG